MDSIFEKIRQFFRRLTGKDKREREQKIEQLSLEIKKRVLTTLARVIHDDHKSQTWFIDNYINSFSVRYDEDSNIWTLSSPSYAKWTTIAPVFRETIEGYGFKIIDIIQSDGMYASYAIYAKFQIPEKFYE